LHAAAQPESFHQRKKGTQLTVEIRASWSDVPIILATGYGELPKGSELKLPLLRKPYARDDLAAAILKVIERRLGGQHRISCGRAASRVRQEPVTLAEQIDQAFGVAREVDAADRGGYKLRAARLERIQQHLLVRVARGSGNEARCKALAGEYQRLRHDWFSHPP
jgi:hypothetical protein